MQLSIDIFLLPLQVEQAFGSDAPVHFILVRDVGVFPHFHVGKVPEVVAGGRTRCYFGGGGPAPLSSLRNRYFQYIV